MSTAATHASQTKNDPRRVSPAQNKNGQLPKQVARYILDHQVSDRDKARMHDLLVRNQDDGLTPAEKEEMHAFGKAATLLSILKSRARRTLGIKLKTRTLS